MFGKSFQTDELIAKPHLEALHPLEPLVDVSPLAEALEEFASARNWHQFHSPKNLATALSIEAAELLEPFQWLTDEQSRNLPADKLEQVAEELADVLLYTLQLADKLGIDP